MAGQLAERIKKFTHFLQHDLWRIDVDRNSKKHTFWIEVLRVTHLVLKSVKEDNCKLHASALTYATLMAMVPFLVILFSISSAIGFPTAKEWLMNQAQQMPQIQGFVDNLISMVEQVNVATLGMFGGVIFLYIIFMLLSEIEESFNQIWGAHSSRSIADKVRNYLSVLVVTPILMIGAQYLTIKLATVSSEIEWLGTFIKTLLQLTPVLVMTLAFIAVLMFLPNTQVQFKAALIGGFTSALLAILLQMLMVKVGIGVTRLSAIYGTFAYIPIFLFWLQMSWTILLFGAELAFAIQNRETYAEEQAAVRASMVSKLWVAFSVMREAVRIFEGPEASIDTTAYARNNNIPIRLMNEIVDVLCRAKLLGAVAPEGQNCYVLLQAPEHVTAKRIYDLMIAEGSSPDELGLVKAEITEQVLASANMGLDESLDPITLNKLFSDDNS